MTNESFLKYFLIPFKRAVYPCMSCPSSFSVVTPANVFWRLAGGCALKSVENIKGPRQTSSSVDETSKAHLLCFHLLT